MHHIYSRGPNVGNDCADHAVALGSGSFGIKTLTPGVSVLLSTAMPRLFCAFVNLDEIENILRDVRRVHTLVPRLQDRG